MKHFVDLTVRPYECDSYSHVNNAVYLNYLEHARMEYLKQIGFDYNAAVEEGFFLYVTHVDIHYKFSARMGDNLKIEVYSKKLGAVSGTIHQVVRKEDGTICAVADVSWCSVDSKTSQPARLPEKFLVPGLKPDPQDQD